MIYLRWLRLLDRVSHVLRRLPFKDRWGFNLGDDLCEWAGMKEWTYVDGIKAVHEERFTSVDLATARCEPSEGIHVGSNIRITWPEPGGSCDKCGSITYTTGSAA
jgi:hypothetical protein